MNARKLVSVVSRANLYLKRSLVSGGVVDSAIDLRTPLWASSPPAAWRSLHSCCALSGIPASTADVHRTTLAPSFHHSALPAPRVHGAAIRSFMSSPVCSADEPERIAQQGPRKFVKNQRNLRQPKPVKAYLDGPRIIVEPYRTPPKFTFMSLFDSDRWLLRKEWFLGQIKSMYCLAKLYKESQDLKMPGGGFDVGSFKKEVCLKLYADINRGLAKNDRNTVRLLCTDNMFSLVKGEIKAREQSGWADMDWGVKKMKTVSVCQARLVSTDPTSDSLDSAFAQITVYFHSDQVFAAYDKSGKVVSGDINKTLDVEDCWVFERRMGRMDSVWRLAGRIKV